MISGKIGITRITSVISERTPSVVAAEVARPRRRRARRSAVARPPTANAIRIDCRVPQTSCEKTSWPYAVVPNRWCAEGPSPRG